MTITPAVLVTGADSRGNEFCFWKMYDGQWVDGYNEGIASLKFVELQVIPNVKKVYFAHIVMTGDEWRANGSPLSLTRAEMAAWDEAKTQESWLDDAMIFSSPVVFACNKHCGAEPQGKVYRTDAANYDMTPVPSDMPVIDFEDIKEIPY